MNAKTLISATDISIGYTHKKTTITVASKVNVQLETGKLVALVGANGIGKSTLLKTLTGIQKPLQGTVFLEDKKIDTYNPLELAQKLSLVLTEKLPPSNLIVFELIALGRQPYTNWIGTLTSNDITKVNEAMELTQISHLAHKKHFEISDGQLQKVLIARALAQDTELIILDEPSTHLDLLHKVALFKLLKKLTSELGKCILLSTHDIDMAIQLSDEMIIMTPEATFQDQPCNFISKGTFSTLFKDDHIAFDADKGKFVIT
ncbi:ABC transporter ATP-binding protein [Flavobacterium sp. K77]|uniref:ABC transporter ATP-binding protein n=1 Tax=Flavobacterium sp. K77 TaxID=2910676 RepID=UPI001F352EE1|nr:ABC transporter ATP-binding protein [Flavobacterium sp. K77]MCF6140586.1 ABC transporter ATP-binding protein [Flavobacterium sp. K77]